MSGSLNDYWLAINCSFEISMDALFHSAWRVSYAPFRN